MMNCGNSEKGSHFLFSASLQWVTKLRGFSWPACTRSKSQWKKNQELGGGFIGALSNITQRDKISTELDEKREQRLGLGACCRCVAFGPR